MKTSRVKRISAIIMAVLLTVGIIPTEWAAKRVVAEETADSNTVTYTLETSSLTSFAAGTKKDGDEESVGTDNFFTAIYSAKSKIDSSGKTFDDGYQSSQRINFGGKMVVGDTTKNAIKFTTEYDNAKVKIWWVEGGDDNRQMAIYNTSGETVAITDETLAKNACAISTLSVEAAGTYYLGGYTNNNYIFKVEVTETKPAEAVVNEYTLETSTLTSFTAGAKKDGDEESAGTDNFFTAIYSAKSKIDSSGKTFDDGYQSSQRINFGGKMVVGDTTKNAIKFTTEGTATVTVWWAEGGDDNRQMAIYNASGETVAITSETLAKNACAITSMTLEEAGTYYLGGYTNNNYIFKVVVTDVVGALPDKPARADWSKVTAPVITSAADDGNGSITVNFDMVIGYDGADKVTVKMTNESGEEETRNCSKEGTSASVKFEPKASGKYTFSIVAVREGESELNGAEKKDADFVLPLTAPAVNSVTNKGNGTVEVVWDAAKEAVFYVVTVNGEEKVKTTDTSATVTGLTVGETYTIGVKAARDDKDKTTIGTTASVTVKDTVERAWGFVVYGASVDLKNNTYTGGVNDGELKLSSANGKGKIVPKSCQDGLAFYYTVINPETENFTLEADITVDTINITDGQEGFGIMAADTIGVNGSTDVVWNNSIQNVVSKMEYYYDGEAVTTDTTATKITMKNGVGTNVRLGITADDIAYYKQNGTFLCSDNTTKATPEGFTAKSYTLETSCAANGAGTYNIVANNTTAGDKTTVENPVKTFHMSLQRNNTGYIVKYSDENGNVIGEKLIYDIERNALTQIEKDKIYVGFFTARNASVTVNNIKFTTVKPEDDVAAQERETEFIEPVYTIESATTANSEDYTLVFYGNADGKLTVVDAKNNKLADNMDVTANTKTPIKTKIATGTTEFTVTFTPNADYVPGDYQKLSTYETKTFTHTVSYKKLSGDVLYVSPQGTSSGKGTKKSPLDIYTAVKYAQAGQTVVLAGGTYALEKTVKIERGINGTQDNMIYMIADASDSKRPVLDFQGKCPGMVLAGDYWYFQGFDVTNSANAQKGVQVSGNYNTLDGIRTYRNGNTGIQISRYLITDMNENWPSYNTILNCTSYLNADAGYEDADGFAAKLTVGEGNVFDGCISAYNADDGWDLYAKSETGKIGKVTLKNCIAFKNGYVLDANGNEVNAGNGNGFKMGGESLSGYHTLINSIAFANKAKGIDSNSCPDIQVKDSISFDNESYNVAFYTNMAVSTDFAAAGLISYKVSNDIADSFKKINQDETKYMNNSNFFTYGKKTSKNTDNVTVSDDWFVSIDTDSVVKNAAAAMLIDSFGLAVKSTNTLKSNLAAALSESGITRNDNGTINTNGYLSLTALAAEKTGKTAGQLIGGTESKTLSVTIPEGEDEQKPSEESKEDESKTEESKEDESKTDNSSEVAADNEIVDGPKAEVAADETNTGDNNTTNVLVYMILMAAALGCGAFTFARKKKEN